MSTWCPPWQTQNILRSCGKLVQPKTPNKKALNFQPCTVFDSDCLSRLLTCHLNTNFSRKTHQYQPILLMKRWWHFKRDFDRSCLVVKQPFNSVVLACILALSIVFCMSFQKGIPPFHHSELPNRMGFLGTQRYNPTDHGCLEILKGAAHIEISFESFMVNLNIQSRKEVSKVSKNSCATCGRWETDLRRKKTDIQKMRSEVTRPFCKPQNPCLFLWVGYGEYICTPLKFHPPFFKGELCTLRRRETFGTLRDL